MCTYTRAVFECGHELWGSRVKVCPVGQSRLACVYRQPHMSQTVILRRKCHTCNEMDRRIAAFKFRVEEFREKLRKQWPERVARMNERTELAAGPSDRSFDTTRGSEGTDI